MKTVQTDIIDSVNLAEPIYLTVMRICVDKVGLKASIGGNSDCFKLKPLPLAHNPEYGQSSDFINHTISSTVIPPDW